MIAPGERFATKSHGQQKVLAVATRHENNFGFVVRSG